MTYNWRVHLRNFLFANLTTKLVRNYYRLFWGVHVGENTRISLSAKLDKTNPNGLIIGKYTAITFGAAILTHDFVNMEHKQTKIGDYTFIGAHAVVMPGVTIGDHCIIAACSLVMRDVPSNTVVMGNPARTIEKDIMTGPWGIRLRDVAAGAPEDAATAELATV